MTQRSMFVRLFGVMIGLTGVALVILGLVLRSTLHTRAQAGQQLASADLIHQPVGTTHVMWSAQTQTLTVHAQMTGLAPSSSHPAHLYAGTCSDLGAVIFPLQAVVANAAGEATSTTAIEKVAGGIPAGGWSVVVHNGPALSPAVQADPIACAEVHPPQANQSANQDVTGTLQGTNAPDQQASGAATLSIHDATLTVTVTAQHLAPNSTHPGHIHAGSCQRQTPGTVVYPLQPLAADAHGNARAVTVIHSVTTIPSSGWYVNIHRGSPLGETWNFDPILCGNVVHK